MKRFKSKHISETDVKRELLEYIQGELDRERHSNVDFWDYDYLVSLKTDTFALNSLAMRLYNYYRHKNYKDQLPLALNIILSTAAADALQYSPSRGVTTIRAEVKNLNAYIEAWKEALIIK